MSDLPPRLYIYIYVSNARFTGSVDEHIPALLLSDMPGYGGAVRCISTRPASVVAVDMCRLHVGGG